MPEHTVDREDTITEKLWIWYDTSSKLHGKLSKKYIFMEIAAIEDTHLFIGVKGTD